MIRNNRDIAPGNPYRRPKPTRHEIIHAEKFYLANEKGSYDAHPIPVYLKLCKEYLWVSETLSIPIPSITEWRLTKKGGCITFLDTIAGEELAFNFTKIGFLRFNRRRVEKFLDILAQHARECKQEQALTPNNETQEFRIIQCEKCGASPVHAITLNTYSSVGLAPIAFSSKLVPTRHVLCPDHISGETIRACLRTAAMGYWGLPGCIAAPCYVIQNLWALKKSGLADGQTVAICVLSSIVLPLAIIASVVVILINL